jgi:hypothetical protein
MKRSDLPPDLPPDHPLLSGTAVDEEGKTVVLEEESAPSEEAEEQGGEPEVSPEGDQEPASTEEAGEG